MSTWDFCFWLRGFLDGAEDVGGLGPTDVARIRHKLDETIAKDSKAAPAPAIQWPPSYFGNRY